MTESFNLTGMNPVRDRARTMLLSALAACLLAGGPAVADDKLYKWVDEDGNVTYQDQPPPDGSGQQETFVEDLGSSEPAAAQPDVNVVLYSIETCDACDLVRKILEDQRVAFQEKNAEDDVDVQAEIREVAGTLSVPVLVIGDEVLTGYNKRMVLNELEDAGLTQQAAGDRESGQATREERERLSSEERQQAAEDSDGFAEDGGFPLDEDIFSDSGSGSDDIRDLEEIPEDERIRINQ